jgi:NTP pyrophosphatase (non-canonical NTP hydrolase)
LACTKFKNASKKAWVAKLNEEVGEVIEALYDTSADKTHLIREMVDVVTVIKSMAYSFGINDGAWNYMQAWVNNRNVTRGYMYEPEEEPSND